MPVPLPPPALVARLRAAGSVFAEDEAALLVEAAAGDESSLAEMVEARVAGTPLEVVVGSVDFAGLRLHVAAGVFVPRRRTRTLLRAALAERAGVAVDLCCGNGALAAGLLAAWPDAEVHAADLDPAAVAAARRNLPPERVHEGDLFAALPPRIRGGVDLVTCNAPYVPTAEIAAMPPEARDHEHRLALDGGADGLDVHRRVAAEVGDWLAPGGRLVIEVAGAQCVAATALLEDAGLVVTEVRDAEVGGLALVGRHLLGT
ncbi:putative protein N(5)-glutamine methyltransferase [Nocardioides sp. SYSU D00038]|uniref:putative protein N(5)-glutamine methyltransferase n=1 Tax=Nocardioides sp. SYSU D00038 TaxID=2812554 RepID=UPI001F0830D7|nr:putative protein N(5)-glutamine methyltransferase [Nocardioides sp. SYSU D00038]